MSAITSFDDIKEKYDYLRSTGKKVKKSELLEDYLQICPYEARGGLKVDILFEKAYESIEWIAGHFMAWAKGVLTIPKSGA